MSPSPVPYDYDKRSGIRPVSWEEFHGLCKGLVISISSFQPEIVLAIGRGGYYPGTLIAHMLQIELHAIRLSRRVGDVVRFPKPRWITDPPPSVRDHRVLIVDEICDTGETITMVRRRVESMGAQTVRSAVLYSHTWGADIPDYIGLITDALILNPWDREIFRDGRFQFHPEYEKALSAQGLNAGESLLIDAPAIPCAKG